MDRVEAIQRVEKMRDNLVGAKGKAQRQDREALDVLLGLAAKASRP